ncbi:major facilitator super transporter protein [Friedmanniomyces endolithicus]|nr:major facilitator super transporter protein [Friedmanniomyces endolithicus]KAK0784233.1 major facilitator super transporter protein [Friedmanniomyces endolithicus]KAK0803530.1 major facilitator super transporter protein [Friedmanniomyces endolithicus]KAK0826923.1 major facilitator super transporter protein [Friedmanniomyces endolithicus]
MPRIKALTTGSVPSFADLLFNLDESGGGSSSLATQDTWLAQIRARGAKLVFYGDDTWLRLFPPEAEFFARAEGTSSFFVSDFTEVDQNVTRHLPRELASNDWQGMVLHFLGLDHIGHKTGPQGVNMLPKQREMDDIVKTIYEAMETESHLEDTLLVLAGDHGMNAGGNHGGSGPGETEPALVFASPKFGAMRKGKGHESPTTPKEGTEFSYYRKVQQSDLVPSLAGLMGLPIPRNSLGVFVRELGGVWEGRGSGTAMLWGNAVQMLRIVEVTYGVQAFRALVERRRACLGVGGEASEDCGGCGEPAGAEEVLARYWARASSAVSGLDTDQSASWDTIDGYIYDFLVAAQETLSSAASSYDIPRMVVGIFLSATALTLAILSLPNLWPPTTAGVFFTATSLLYGAMMFASSYVEEEQQFWYWLACAWTLLLTVRSVSRAEGSKRTKIRIVAAGALILAVHREATRWNQTGQKHAGAPDIVHGFFPDYHMTMWVLVLWTYGRNCYTLARRTFLDILPTEAAVAAAVALTVPAIVFKLNFTQADAPELVQGLAMMIRRWTEPFSLVLQAQVTFGLLALATATTVVLAVGLPHGTSIAGKDGPAVNVTLAERLHYLLTLFLITQSRTPNIPLFLGLELQLLALSVLLDASSASNEKRTSRRNGFISPTELATTVLLCSHVYFFCMGGSNSISSVDLSNAYNGIADYNVTAVGLLLFTSNWTGPVWWCSAAVSLTFSKRVKAVESAKPIINGKRGWVDDERERLRRDAKAGLVSTSNDPATQDHWMVYVSSMTAFVAASLLAVMVACTALRTHLFIWTVFSPKYLYVMAWCVGWHILVNIGLGSLLRWLGEMA